ncbi:hypothetical protein M0812_28901 [Anaeramoeba flamelloides]|uniref:Uncharacterized protein n=1 Tax=Anaeramoeba flamelloides TaxID=1746091 RepID=A0AAV7YEC8_9EUKA|nr:hypothetical protein M0812_28901 [Anaeramoeba flamelloides]
MHNKNIFLFLFYFFFLHTFVFSCSTYVKVGNVDDGDCSITPCGSISYALSYTNDNQTICLYQGTHKINATLKLKGQHLKSMNSGEEVIIDGRGVHQCILIVNIVKTIIDGIHFQNCKSNDKGKRSKFINFYIFSMEVLYCNFILRKKKICTHKYNNYCFILLVFSFSVEYSFRCNVMKIFNFNICFYFFHNYY